MAVWLKGTCRWTWAILISALITAASICAGTSSFAWSQTSPSKVAGLEHILPVLPEVAPRPLEGPGAGQQLNVASPADEVASFVESLKSNDAAFKVIVGQGRLLTLKRDIAAQNAAAVVAVGDPSVLEFQILPNPRMIRIVGLRPGVTDLSITTADGDSISLEVHVTFDLALLEAQLRQIFPSARLKLAQLREHIIVEGQARSSSQVSRIIETLKAYLESMEASASSQQGQAAGDSLLDSAGAAAENSSAPAAPGNVENRGPGPQASIEQGVAPSIQAPLTRSRVINLIKVPGIQQVMLKVRIAELNRTAMREIGADILAVDPDTGNILGTQIGGAAISAMGIAGLNGLIGTASGELGSSSTAFGIFPSDDYQIIFRALRQNGLVRVLAEPNLITLSGHRANFLAGGEFPVPVPQSSGGVSTSVTVDFREFGVRLDFLPFVMDNDRIRLSVTPEVSTVDFSLGTTLVVGGDPVPGLNTRRANTTVELAKGQTLAMAGLLQVESDGQTSRIPGLGDLPYIGPLFSNTTNRRMEKELLVLVTPQLVRPMDEGEVPLLPGDCVEEPTDFELYLGNQYEGRLNRNHRSTVDFPFGPRRRIESDRVHVSGPVGFGG